MIGDFLGIFLTDVVGEELDVVEKDEVEGTIGSADFGVVGEERKEFDVIITEDIGKGGHDEEFIEEGLDFGGVEVVLALVFTEVGMLTWREEVEVACEEEGLL